MGDWCNGNTSALQAETGSSILPSSTKQRLFNVIIFLSYKYIFIEEENDMEYGWLWGFLAFLLVGGFFAWPMVKDVAQKIIAKFKN